MRPGIDYANSAYPPHSYDRCGRCNKTWYEHRDHEHKPYPTCPFGDCDEWRTAR